jgi:tetratricopeptide (TPR) repeat protein
MAATLSMPDHPLWRREHQYSPAVAAALAHAYQAIGRPARGDLVAAYCQAESALLPCLRQPMSLRQRMLIGYILGLACMSTDRFALAAEHFDIALEVAMQLHDLHAGIELAHLNAQLYWHREELGTAARYASLSLEILRTPTGDETACILADAELTLDVLARAALIDWFRGDYEHCMQFADLAGRMLGKTTTTSTSAAAVTWLHALLLQSRGDLEAALRQALAAAEVYERLGPVGSCTRIHTVVADIALDLADRFAPRGNHSSTAEAFITLAARYVSSALEFARSAQDDAGEGLALLASARLAGLRRDNVDRVVVLESVGWNAERLTDVALLGQTYTALGNELATQDQQDAALSCFRSAIHLLSTAGLSGLAWRARRTLLLTQEMSAT